jgi:hypothetical protein
MVCMVRMVRRVVFKPHWSNFTTFLFCQIITIIGEIFPRSGEDFHFLTNIKLRAYIPQLFIGILRKIWTTLALSNSRTIHKFSTVLYGKKSMQKVGCQKVKILHPMPKRHGIPTKSTLKRHDIPSKSTLKRHGIPSKSTLKRHGIPSKNMLKRHAQKY